MIVTGLIDWTSVQRQTNSYMNQLSAFWDKNVAIENVPGYTRASGRRIRNQMGYLGREIYNIENSHWSRDILQVTDDKKNAARFAIAGAFAMGAEIPLNVTGQHWATQLVTSIVAGLVGFQASSYILRLNNANIGNDMRACGGALMAMLVKFIPGALSSAWSWNSAAPVESNLTEANLAAMNAPSGPASSALSRVVSVMGDYASAASESVIHATNGQQMTAYLNAVSQRLTEWLRTGPDGQEMTAISINIQDPV